MRNILARFILAGVVASAGSLGLEVKAVPITGLIDFQGVVSSDNGDLTLATLLNNFTGVTVGVGTGTFSAQVGQGVTHQSFVFNPSTVTPATPIVGFWTFTHGANTYSFDLETLTIAPGGDATHLGLSGTGTAHATGHTDAAATWSLAATSQGLGTFTFAESTTVSTVPDAGATMVLFAGALCTVGMLRRRMGLAV